MNKCKNSVIFSLYKKVPSGVILQPKIYQEIELFFFKWRGEGGNCKSQRSHQDEIMQN